MECNYVWVISEKWSYYPAAHCFPQLLSNTVSINDSDWSGQHSSLGTTQM